MVRHVHVLTCLWNRVYSALLVGRSPDVPLLSRPSLVQVTLACPVIRLVTPSWSFLSDMSFSTSVTFGLVFMRCFRVLVALDARLASLSIGPATHIFHILCFRVVITQTLA